MQPTGSPLATLNRELETRFDNAAMQGALQPFLHFVNQAMPSLKSVPDLSVVESSLATEPGDEGTLTVAALQSGPVRLTVNHELGIRLYYHGKQVTTDRENIPYHYPWFSIDPADPEKIAAYAIKHVSRGSRADSWPESQWPLVQGVLQGEQNWPPRSVAFGPYDLDLVEDGPVRAIQVGLPSQDGLPVEPNAYGVIPRGLFSVNPDQSVVMAWQNENHSEKGLHWCAWFILGFAMPRANPSYSDPTVIFAIPDSEADDPSTNRMTKVWNYFDINGRRMALINPHVKTLNEPFKKFYRDVNWTVVAEKGADHLILTRSMLRHDEQFFPFLEHGQYFIEAEHTGRLAAPGEKSTVVVRHDFVKLADLTQGKLTQFSTSPAFVEEVQAILAELVALDDAGRLIAVVSE